MPTLRYNTCRNIRVLARLVRERGKVFDGTVNSSGVVLSGISNDLIIQFFNEAQDAMQSRITAGFPVYFQKQITFSIVGGQEAYTLPGNLFNSSKVTQVEYSSNGTTGQYYPLRQRSYYERNSQQFSDPLYYILYNNTVLLNPVPYLGSGMGTVRITYYESLDRLAFPVSTVVSRTIDGSNNLTALTLSIVATQFSELDLDLINRSSGEGGYLCVSSPYGEVNARNITYNSFATGTGVVQLGPGSQPLDTGETVPVGQVVTVGLDTACASALPRECERYLLAYATKRMQSQNSSLEDDPDLMAIQDDILANFQPISADVVDIPNIDPYIGDQ